MCDYTFINLKNSVRNQDSWYLLGERYKQKDTAKIRQKGRK